jgi:hypothetical protein
VLRQCEHFAERLAQASDQLDQQIDLACRSALARPPTEAEAKQFTAYAQKHGLPSLCRVIFNSTEFVFVD